MLIMHREIWTSMQQHVMEEDPLEACGLLAGVDHRVEKVLPVRNAAQSRVRFSMDAQGQFNAFKWIEKNDLSLVGIFHSHPKGPATLSESDIAESAYKVVHILWARTEELWKAYGYWIEGTAVSEAALQVIDRSNST